MTKKRGKNIGNNQGIFSRIYGKPRSADEFRHVNFPLV